jgi:hypothetical protein
MAGAAIFTCATFLANPAGAIPNQIGGVGFINPAGMRLEDFAALPGTWETDAKLKGDWEMWSDPAVSDTAIELLHLKNSAVVFGVNAADVTLQRKDSRVHQFRIVFRPDQKSRDLDRLIKVLRTNAALWADADADAATLQKGPVTIAITANSREGEAVAIITAAKAVAAVTP